MKKQIKIKVAVTGNIGCGKSTFAKFLSDEGFPVLYADEISKRILADDKQVRAEIIKVIGPSAFNGDKPDKKYIADSIFSDTIKLKKINSILHPKVRTEIEKLSQKYFQKTDIVFVEAALIFESKIEKMYDYVVLITSDINLRMQRTMLSKKLSKAEFLQREANQLDEDKKKKKSDFVFSNNTSTKDLQDKALLLIKLLKSIVNQ
ncbi:MAG: dephospho-CoA kinase [Ignavibacteriaceae bacterium]|nr:dephospho-CoA kinase [Ignavibacteriaceae bacterium]